MIIRGQKVLRVKKLDYTRHPEAKFLEPEKTDVHISEWRKAGTVKEMRAEAVEKKEKENQGFDCADKEEEPLTLQEHVRSRKQVRPGMGRRPEEEDSRSQEEHGRIERVEDLFQ